MTIGPPRLDGPDAVVTAAVDAGPVVTIRAIEFRGSDDLPPEALAAAAGLVAGEPSDPQQVEAARQRVEAALRSAGLTRTRVALQPAPAGETPALDVVLIRGGRTRQVLATSSSPATRPPTPTWCCAALRLEAGQPIGTGAWLEARARLFETGLFRRVDVAVEPIAEAPATGLEQPVRVRVTVEEWPALRLRYGFQLAEHRPETEVTGRDLCRPGCPPT